MKKKLLIKLLVGSGCSAIVLPVAATTIVSSVNVKEQKYHFADKEFDNKLELFSWAKENAKKDNIKIREREKWSINWDGKRKYFQNVNELDEFINSKIITHTASTSLNLELDDNLEIQSSDLPKLNLDLNPERVNVYRGRSNSIYKNEIDAKKSYLEIHDAYHFNNLYFRTKEELKLYLKQNYDLIDSRDSADVTIKSPSGLVTKPISIKELKNNNQDEINYLRNFILDNNKKYIEMKVGENSNDGYWYYDQKDIEKNIGNVVTNFNDYSFVPINSNQGEPNYIVDLSSSDDFDLIGPYYVKSSSTIKQITNKDKWRKIEGNDYKYADNQILLNLFSNFINIFSEDTDNSAYPFSIKNIQGKINDYFESLHQEYPNVFDSVINLNKQMKRGKRYSSFYKMPILYIHTIEQLVLNCADQNMIERTREFYNYVANYIDSQLECLVPKDFLLSSNQKVEFKKFSFTELFGFNNKSFDLNSNIETFTDKIVDSFPKLLEFVKFFNMAFAISQYIPDVIPFNITFLEKIMGFNHQYWNNEEIQYLKELWDALFTCNKDKFDSIIMKNYSDNVGKEISNNLLQDIEYTFVFRRELAIENINLKIIDSINSFNDKASINQNKYMSNSQYYYDEKSIFNLWPIEVIKNFINWYSNNSIDNINLYKKVFAINYYIKNNNSSNSIDDIKNFSEKSINAQLDWLNKSFLKLKDFNSFLDSVKDIYGMTFIENQILISNKIDCNKYSSKYNNETKDYILQTQAHKQRIESIFQSATGGGNIFSDEIWKDFPKVGKLIKVIPYVDIALTVIEFLIPKTEDFSYVFESGNDKFIWNGGSKTTFLGGLIPITNSDINDMKINSPIKVTEQHMENCMYYNGKKYFDSDSLKKHQLRDILNGNFTHSNAIKIKYSFDNLNIQQDSPSKLAFESLEGGSNNLLDYVINSIISGNKNYISSKVFKYGNGYTFDKTKGEELNIKEIVDNIKPVKIATLPKLDPNNFPIGSDNDWSDNAIPKYQLPEKSWTAKGGISLNETNNKYIIVDPNIVESQSEINSESDSSQILIRIFLNSFSVPSKNIIFSDIVYTNKFSDLSTNVNVLPIYEIKLQNGLKKYFKDKSLAASWLLSQLNFEVHDYFIDKTSYEFDGNHFNNVDEFLLWVERKAGA